MTPEAAPIRLDVDDCPRCGGRHDGLYFLPSDEGRPIFTHAAACPDTDEMILLRTPLHTDATDAPCVGGPLDGIRLPITRGSIVRHFGGVYLLLADAGVPPRYGFFPDQQESNA